MGLLPRVKIEYGNGALGQAVTSNDGLLCLVVIGCKDVREGFQLGQLYSINRLADLDALNVLDSYENNYLYYTVKDFYTQAQDGTQLYVIGFPTDYQMSILLEKDNRYLTDIIEKTNGEIRGFIVGQAFDKNLEGSDSYYIENGVIADLFPAMENAQRLGEWATTVKNAPIFTIIEGFLYQNGHDLNEPLFDLSKYSYNRVGVVIGGEWGAPFNQSVGLVAGRIAASPVHRHIGRVKDGAITSKQMYIDYLPVESYPVGSFTQNHIITFRTFTGLAGYYIADDLLATKETDDYNQLTRRRTIDKAYRIAYPCLVEELNDEIPVNEDGTIMETAATAIEQKVINAIALNMTARGELSADPKDPNDYGVKCEIDRTNNVLATNQIRMTLRVRPFGYAKYIDVLLGFQVTQN